MLILTKPLHSALKNAFSRLPLSREIIWPTTTKFTVKLVYTCTGILVIKIILLHVALNSRGVLKIKGFSLSRLWGGGKKR